MSEYVFRNTTSIGNLEAETDSFLEKCFVETEAYKVLSSFDVADSTNFLKRIIVGRTGSGKTALLEHIKKHAVISSKTEIEAETTIFEYINNNKFINNLMCNHVDLTMFFKVLWNHVILVKILTVLTEPKTIFSYIRNVCSDLTTYIEDYGDTFFTDDALTTITEKFQEKIEGKIGSVNVNLSAGDCDEQTKQIQTQTNAYVNKELLSKQKKIIKYLSDSFRWDKQKSIFITIDDLDKSWISDCKVKYNFINSLIEAMKEFLQLDKLKIIISMRTDILEGLYKNNPQRQEEKDKSFIMPIEWSKEEIRTALDKRIIHLLQDKYQKLLQPRLQDVFNFKVNGINADEYILERTMLRPRDAIDFVNQCFACANGKTLVNKNNVVEAEELYFISRKVA